MNALPELLAPAGTFEKLQIAIRYGADAVYLGGTRYSLRAHAGNFGDDALAAAIGYAHDRGVKVYVTVNIFAHNADLAGLPAYLLTLREAGADALIIADPGVLAVARRTVPELSVHLSTQANVTNRESARFWADQGVKRLNLARELSLAEIREIRAATTAELELFTHGALCISYSGRCLLSLSLTGRDANQGDCAHPCRYRYRLEEEKRPGQFFPVEEDPRGTYIFSAKDLCLLQRLPDLIAAGADSLKLEGRMKSVYYVGAIVRLYRAALDHWRAHGLPTPGETTALPAAFGEELRKIGSRGYTENFLDEPPGPSDMLYEGATVRADYAPVGIVREEGAQPLIETRNPIVAGDLVEYLGPGLATIPARIVAITDQEGTAMSRANPNQLVRLTLDPPAREWHVLGLLRKQMDTAPTAS
ncbi:MAG TPA: U32 family peptidase [Desulfurivibrionaceae bacterium]|nr:U32 family peptidase [Desulfurivibrionaceae bacterium]